jgi:hypothetical protein
VRPERPGQRMEAFGVDAVVVGDQNSHVAVIARNRPL